MNKTLKLLSPAIFGAIMLPFSTIQAAELKTDDQKFSYAVGFQIGQNLKAQGLDKLDTAALGQAIDDILNGRELKLSMEEMQTVFKAKQEKMMAERNAKADKAKAAGEKFLADNKAKEGVIALASGVQYKVVKKGEGKKPTAENTVVAHYRGTLINGKEFDSSYTRGEPATFPLNGVIKGWQEVLPMMSVGSKWQVFIPSDLAYGERGAGADIGPHETLIFDIELLEIK
ncbi:FKBP-type peptidyl-prolyl cis-trans isomerase [Kaarinaea lacus]